MQIALYHTTLPEIGRKLGGVEVAVHRLANALTNTANSQITVFSLSPRPADALYQHCHLFRNQPWLQTNRLARLFLLPILLNFVNFKNPDALHFHGDDWFFVRRAMPTIRTLHGSALHEARSATSLPRKLIQYLIYPLEHLSARLARQSLAVGPEAVKLYKADGIADNGVDPDVFFPGVKQTDPSILFVGTWAGRKRGQFVYQIFLDKILPVFPDATLCMVSDYCPEHPQVIAEVFPSNTVLAQRYREAWVFAYPSVYEGFGIPYVEAMASGTAIICTPNSGADYVLSGGKYGIIATDDLFGEELLTLLQDAAKRKKMAELGRQRSAELSWAEIADQHLKIYRKISDRISQ